MYYVLTAGPYSDEHVEAPLASRMVLSSDCSAQAPSSAQPNQAPNSGQPPVRASSQPSQRLPRPAKHCFCWFYYLFCVFLRVFWFFAFGASPAATHRPSSQLKPAS